MTDPIETQLEEMMARYEATKTLGYPIKSRLYKSCADIPKLVKAVRRYEEFCDYIDRYCDEVSIKPCRQDIAKILAQKDQP